MKVFLRFQFNNVLILIIFVKNIRYKQKELIGAEEADGILYTENKIRSDETTDVKYPTALESKCIRASHVYNITFAHVRENFAVAGLLSLVQVNFITTEKAFNFEFCFRTILFVFCFFFRFQDSILQFDGVYYQKLMEDFAKISQTERKKLIENYRLYV